MVARVVAAFVLAPPFLYLNWLGGWPMAGLFAAIAALAAHEMVAMGATDGVGPRPLVAVPWAAAFPLVCQGYGLSGAATVLAVGLPLLVLPAVRRGETKGEGRAAAFTVLTVILTGFSLGFTVLVRSALPRGEALILVLLALVWAQDTAAYFVGCAIGRHKLTAVSPKKSWEGSVAGLAGGVAAAYGMAVVMGLEVARPVVFVAVLALAGVAGQLGDLFESLIKRDAGVKDSGSLIPGHGGLLDRFDSLFAAAPVLYFLLNVLPLTK